jgi:hypothetical protein
MGIEPTREALPSLENKRFGAMADAKCDWRVEDRIRSGARCRPAGTTSSNQY